MTEEKNNVFDSEDILQPLRRHIVSLALTDILKTPQSSSDDAAKDFDIQIFCISTFAIEMPIDSEHKTWFLVTAGHIIQDISTRLKSTRRILKSRLLDGTPGETGAIPFDFDLSTVFHIYRDGYDYGLIPLREFYVRALIKGGVRALNDNNWTNIPESADEYYMLGFPTQAQIIKITCNRDWGKVHVDLGVPLIPVQPLATPPNELKKSVERFYANIPIVTGQIRGRTITLTDINGMSGGPIFAVKRIDQNRISYWIVAVQSGWLSERRILAACFIRPIIDGLYTSIKQQYHDLIKYSDIDADI